MILHNLFKDILHSNISLIEASLVDLLVCSVKKCSKKHNNSFKVYWKWQWIFITILFHKFQKNWFYTFGTDCVGSVTLDSGTLAYPFTENSLSYSHTELCHWQIHVNSTKLVQVSLNSLKLSGGVPCSSFVQVRLKSFSLLY